MPHTSFDSLSTFHDNNDRYTVHNTQNFNTAIKRDMTSVSMRQRDSLDSSNQQYDRQSSERFRDALVFSDSKVMVVAKVGKYAVLAILLPPYIFLYGIPKWLLTVGGPQLIEVTKKANQMVINGLLNLLALTNLPFKGLKKLLHKIGNKFADMANVLKQWFELMGEKLQAMNKAALDKLQALLKYPGKCLSFLLTGIENGAARMQEWLKAMQNGTSRALLIISTPFQRLGQSLADRFNSIQESLLNVMKRAWEKIDDVAKSLRSKLKEYRERVGEKFQRAGEWTAEKLQQYAKPVVAWVEPKVKWLSDKMESFWKAAATQATAIQEKASSVYQTISDIIKPIPIHCWNILQGPRIVEQGCKFAFAFVNLAKNIQAIIRSLSHFPINFGKAVKRRFERIKQNITRKVGALKGFAKKGQTWLKKGAQWSFKKAKRAPRKAIEVSKSSIKFLFRTINAFFRGIRVFCIWLMLFLRHCIEVIQIQTSKILKI